MLKLIFQPTKEEKKKNHNKHIEVYIGESRKPLYKARSKHLLPSKINHINNYKNKRAQRALDRSPEEKFKGHSGAYNREPQVHNLNNFGRGPFDDVIYKI